MNVLFYIDQESKRYSFHNFEHDLEYPFGYVLIAFFSIDFFEFFDCLIELVKKEKFEFGLYYQGDVEKLRRIINKICNNPVISELILNEILENLYGADLIGKEKVLKCITDKTTYMMSSYLSFYDKIYSFLASKKVINRWPDEQSYIIRDAHIDFSFYLNNKDETLMLCHASDLLSFLSLDMFNIQSNHIVIKQCENCGKLFIPSKRSDEIYCDRIYKNGKTCKQIGYSMKEQSDPFKREFAKARKTQHARIRYNRHIKDYKEKHYLPWLNAAQEAKKKYEATNDITGFCDWLEKNKNAF